MRRNQWVATVLAIAAGLGLAAVAVAADAGEPRTPETRLTTIVPLVEAAVTKSDDYELKLAQRSAATKIPPQRLELWMKLFLSHGKRGLHPVDTASAIEIARAVEGTWEMNSRVVEGEEEEVNSWQFNRIIEIRDGYAAVESLTLEDGYLAPSLCGGNRECSFRLGAYGIVKYQEVTGMAHGLSPGETAVKMDFEGHISGEGYPGFENDVRGVISALWVKQGSAYRTAVFKHRFEGLTQQVPAMPDLKHSIEDHMPVYLNDAILELVDDTQSLEYEAQQAVETQHLASPTVRIWSLPEYWDMILEDNRYIAPDVAQNATSPLAAHRALQRKLRK